jgi:hypothetical protein
MLARSGEINAKYIDSALSSESSEAFEIQFELTSEFRVGVTNISEEMLIHLQQLFDVAVKHSKVNPCKCST